LIPTQPIRLSPVQYQSELNYSTAGKHYQVYLSNEDDPSRLRFAVDLLPSFKDSHSAWARKSSEDFIDIIRNGAVEFTVPAPSWNSDQYDSVSEYIMELLDVACNTLAEANKFN